MSTVPDFLKHLGGVPVGMEILQPPEVRWVYSSTTAAPYTSLSKTVTDANDLHSTIALAHTAATTGRNDTVFVTPETHTLTAAVTWSKSNTHLVGMHGSSPWSNNCKITHTSGLSINNMITVSGSDNIFANLHIEFAVGAQGANHTGLYNTGNGNHYENVWFEGPVDATQGTDTAVELVLVDGGGNYFKNCIFGTTAHNTMNGAALLGFTGSAYRTTFENCIFYMSTASTSGVMIDASSSADISGPQFFKNCMFVSWWTSAVDQCAACVRGTGVTLGTGLLVFDPSCIFVGFNAIAAPAGELGFIYAGHSLTAAHSGANAGIIVRASGTNP